MGYPSKEAKQEYERAYYQKNLFARRKKSRDYGHSFTGKAHYLIRISKKRAETKGWEFNLDWQWVEEKLTQHCELSGIPFGMENERIEWDSPTLDRIDNSRGYTKDNCRVILFSLNALKGSMTDKHMFKLMGCVLGRYPGTKGRI